MKLTPIYSDVKQGSEAWFAARLGRPTASRFDAIVTPLGKATKSAARQTYIYELVAERLTNRAMSNFVSPAMERGTMLEPAARSWYEFQTDRTVKQVGFVTTKEHRGRFGCSPDGIMDDRGLEIKCPVGHNQIRLLLESDQDAASDYVVQCQAGMWITGLPLWDLVLFSGAEGIPNRIITLKADLALHAAFSAYILAFCSEVDEGEKRLRAMGGGMVITSENTGLRDMSKDL